ncbi:hypothetical protein VN12_06330 [Pirellula sp. SH-Sr6A]|uniref:hypothetical protein n=1 Tax=Pirellula sp. SH-Sr6A TaxID=1632865 RepID=UPI00078DC507|nr:hypothetical protein [Pirellula sp. SH-Sr6A]AMV31719.1 hypothetical protein VN12_06330 [Pirellula sp. SH-Sr6A]
MCKSSEPAGYIGHYLALIMRQGSDFVLRIILTEEDGETPFDATGFTARAHMSNGKTRTAIAANFEPGGVLVLSKPASETTLLKAGSLSDSLGSYEWDCEFLHGQEVVPAFYGPVTVVKDI